MIARFHYDDETLGHLLRARRCDEDPSGDEDREVAQHVETCEQCQIRLETITQDGLTWEEAGELLRADDFDEQTEVTWDGIGPRAGRTFLQSTEHPGSLGRFGRYEIMEFLGRGGMGIVMRGFDPALNRHSAIKVLAPELASSAAARRRFSREAKSAAAVVHPHVVPIQTVDEQEGLPYLVMPVVVGPSLQQRVDATGPLAVVEVVRIAAQIADGLAAAHDRGLVHRDIKPANILLENGVERVQITDFGLARAADDASMTRSGVIAGTPQYMSPEQAHGDEVDHRSDLFSLGSVMYFMLTGRSPFRADTTMGVLNRIGNDHPRRLRSINPDIPPWLSSVVHRLLEKNPAKRYASAAALATELQLRLVDLQHGADAATKRTPPIGDQPPRWRWAIVSGGAAMFVLLAGLFLIETDQGTIRIETNEDVTVPVRIRQGDEVVQRLTVTSDGASTRVRAGAYVIEIEGNEPSLELKNGQATVKSDGEWVARIEVIPPPEVPEPNAGDSQAPRKTRSTGQQRDPSKVRELALEDIRHGRYEQALESILWYWNNATTIDPAQSAVRRSFLLSDWLQLGEAYPPALEKLRSVRDELQQRILSADQVRVRSDDFADFASINRTLREEEKTTQVYDEIRRRDPEDAHRLRHYISDEGRAAAPKAEAGELAAKPSLIEAVEKYNAETAPLRERLFDVEIPDITPQQMIDAFAHAAAVHRRSGKANIADRLQRVVDSKSLDDLEIFLTGVITGDEANPVARQIVPATMIPGGPNVVVPLRKLELMYSRDGYASKTYGDNHPPLDGKWRLAGVEKNRSDLGHEEFTNWAADHPLWNSLVIEGGTLLMDGEGRQSLYDLELDYDANPLPKFTLSQEGMRKFGGVFMGNGFVDDTTLILAVDLDGGETPTTFRIEDSTAIKLTYERVVADSEKTDRQSSDSPEFPPVKISVVSEDGKPLPGALAKMRLLDSARRDVLLEATDTSTAAGVAINRVLPYGKYYLSVKTAEGWYTSMRGVNVEFDKGLDLTFVAPSPEKHAELVLDSSASATDPSQLASLHFGMFELHSGRRSTGWTQDTTPEPGDDGDVYGSFPTPGRGIDHIAFSINVDIRRHIPQSNGETVQWTWVPDDLPKHRRFLLFDDHFQAITAARSIHAEATEEGEYFELTDRRAKVGGTVMALADPIASPFSVDVPAGEVTVYVQGLYGRPTNDVLASLRLREDLAPSESVWLHSDLKLESAWIDRLLVTDGWTYRRSGDGTIASHLLRRERTVEPGETLEISIEHAVEQPKEESDSAAVPQAGG